ncbi:MAG: NAD(P)/FAD-dependent oxidoreductase [Pseudomonadota bacterium]
MASKHVVIMGAGLGGLTAAIKLKEAGHTFEILEKHPRVGGTWHQNTYPGCACDVPVALYQLSFAQSLNWTRLFPQAPEIQAYAEEIADRYQLGPHLHLGEAAEAAVWDDTAQHWSVKTANGRTITADAIVGALGQLNRPQWPSIEGLDQFSGDKMHSAQWDHGVDLKHKRVAVVGSAASAVQIIPELQSQVARLTVFQRTPNWVVPRNDRAVPPEELALMLSDPELAVDLGARNRQVIFDTADAYFWQAFQWTEAGRAAYTRQALDHLAAQVSDPDLRAKLTPGYPIGCKRILITDDYYPAMCAENVDLVTDPISKATADGLVTEAGHSYDFDVLVFATGFETTGWKWSVEVEGRGGARLNDVWAEYPQAYRGMTVSGFPNLFILYGPNTNLGHNSITYMLERQVEYAVKALAALDAAGARAMAPRPAAQAAWNAELQEELSKTVWADPTCASWYKNEAGRITQNWSSNCRAFAKAVAEVQLEDYELA